MLSQMSPPVGSVAPSLGNRASAFTDFFSLKQRMFSPPAPQRETKAGGSDRFQSDVLVSAPETQCHLRLSKLYGRKC